MAATKPEESGDYYAWGEVETKTDYSWSTYKWCNGSDYTLTKYCNNSDYGNEGFTDTLTVLTPEDDIAHVKWGGSWRMPTKAEQDELRNNCTWTWYSGGNTEFNGIAGYKVTSNREGYTDQSIFLPVAGCYSGTGFGGVFGDYWSSSLNTDIPYHAYYLYFDSGVVSFYDIWNRYTGRSVRPVCPKETPNDLNPTNTITSVSLDTTSLTLTVGEEYSLNATAWSGNVEIVAATVIRKSENESIATVSTDGLVKAISVGTTTITVQAGDKTASCKIMVAKKNIPVSGITLNKESIYLTENRSELLQANISPSDATNTTIIWDSSDKSVAVVYDGLVQSIEVGTTTISAKTEDGGYIAYCEVNVIHIDSGAVDLGLSVKWASCNIGATSPEDAGFYFAWADPVGYVRNDNNDGWVLASNRDVTHSFNEKTYQASSAYSVISDITPDSGHDSARENWGDEWRMPSSSDFGELKNGCDSKLISLNGKEGFLFTSKKTGHTGKSIFLPIGGGFGASSFLNFWNNSESYYWTNQYVTDNEPTYFSCGNRGMGCYYGSCCSYMGLNIRAVK